MKSTTARTVRSTRPALVRDSAPSLQSTPQDPNVVGTGVDYEVKADKCVQLDSIPEGDDAGDRWMHWVATVYYRTSDDGGPCVRLLAQRTDYSCMPPEESRADFAQAIGILSIKEFRAVVAGLNELAASLPAEPPFASAAALERGK